MNRFKIKKGLNLPIQGSPKQNIEPGNSAKTIAILGSDYPGMKPTMLVQEGDKVKLGQPVFEDKKMPGVAYTSPATGTVIKINRGEKRVFLSMVIQIGGEGLMQFPSFDETAIKELNEDKVRSQLLESGLWTALRTRPFGKVANPETKPRSIFVTAMDTEPLAPDINVILEGNEEAYKAGLLALEKLTTGKIHVCVAPNSSIPENGAAAAQYHEFSGPHPAGLPSTHIHLLDPVNLNKTVWQIGLQDVIAIGHLFLTGEIKVDRVISLAGPKVKNPRLIKTRIGASILELTENEIDNDTDVRRISGSVLSGSTANDEDLGFLGRYHQQVSVIEDSSKRELLGMIMPGANKFSIKNVFLSRLFFGKMFNLTTSTNGSSRAMVPIGSYEKVMPLDIIPTFLLRSAVVRDTDKVMELGGLELVEEDLSLCTFVCPSKYDFGPILRDNLNIIEKEEVEG